MKIGILGTRGIPNNYGGFEQFAEYLAQKLVERGHDVTVYNGSDHYYQKNIWNGVKIVHKFCNERKLKIFGTLIYDYLCLKDAVEEQYDIVLELGYVPSSIFFKSFKRKLKGKIITNMDGLEWKRSKWSLLVKQFIKYCERKGVEDSDYLISDNIGIKTYLKDKFNADSTFIPYSSDIIKIEEEGVLFKYGITKERYFMLVARLEPENNLEMILDGYLKSNSNHPFLVIGKHNTKYGEHLYDKYNGVKEIMFLGGIYDYHDLTAIRKLSEIYFHGHTVGGTNPSLLDAMASGAFIAAHDNEFNNNVIEKDGLRFKDSTEVADIINRADDFDYSERVRCVDANFTKIRDIYNWDSITDKYIECFEKVLKA